LLIIIQRNRRRNPTSAVFFCPFFLKGLPFSFFGRPFVCFSSQFFSFSHPFSENGNQFFSFGYPFSGKGQPFFAFGSPIVSFGMQIFSFGYPFAGKGQPFFSFCLPFFLFCLPFAAIVANGRSFFLFVLPSRKTKSHENRSSNFSERCRNSVERLSLCQLLHQEKRFGKSFFDGQGGGSRKNKHRQI
jgi:hypothetical protein